MLVNKYGNTYIISAQILVKVCTLQFLLQFGLQVRYSRLVHTVWIVLINIDWYTHTPLASAHLHLQVQQQCSSKCEPQYIHKLVLVKQYGNVQLVHKVQQWYVYLTVPIAHFHLQVQQQC